MLLCFGLMILLKGFVVVGCVVVVVLLVVILYVLMVGDDKIFDLVVIMLCELCLVFMR